MRKFLKSMGGTMDLTVGKPMHLIFSFGVPLLLGMLFQQFYNMVDSIIVGKLLGVQALAAVGSTGSINFMIIGFCIGICNGFGIPVAQTFGAKDWKNLRKYITNGAWTAGIISILLTVGVGILTNDILIWMKTPETIFDMAYDYIFVIFMGIPVIFLYNMVSSILRSLGNSITPLLFLVFSSLLNIVLDFVFVVQFGVVGAGLATVIAQAIAGIVCLLYMIRNYKHLEIKREDWKFSKGHAYRLCKMGVPMGLQYSITAIGSVVLQAAVNGLGEIPVAAMTAGLKISMFACSPLDALGSTIATYGGQNLGAGRMDRIRQGLRDCTKIGIIYSLLAFGFLTLFGRSLALLFVDASETLLIEYIYQFLVTNSVAYVLLVIVNVFRFLIQGLGYSTFAVLAGVCEMAARGLAGVVLVPIFGYIAAACSNALAWIFADLFLIPAYFYVMRSLDRKFGCKE